MPSSLKRWVAEPTECAYLPDRDATLEYRLMLDVSPEDLDALLERGWRRFGAAYFRPRCAGCAECVPLRVPVAEFRPTRSQRRVEARGRAISLEVGAPRVDGARLALYERWHRARSERRGWPHESIDAESYFHQFAFPHPSAREFAYFDGGRLVAIAIVDETPRALSAVYTFFDPGWARISPGTLSILRQLEMARRWGKRWLYLGYRVRGCASSAYKARFGPHELMTTWPRGSERGSWTAADPANADPL